MKTCAKCQEQFSTKITLDGKTHNIQNRKFCLKCSPWGEHNTRADIDTHLKKTKICCQCLKEMPNTRDFFYGRSNSSYLNAECKKCSTLKKRREMQEQKEFCVNHNGGKCIICGYKKSISGLAFHHVDPASKEFEFKSATRSKQALIKELKKCILACHNCHAEIHYGLHPQYLVVKDQS